MNGGEARLQDYGVSLGAGACPKTRTLEGRSQLSHQRWGETRVCHVGALGVGLRSGFRIKLLLQVRSRQTQTCMVGRLPHPPPGEERCDKGKPH